MAGCRGRVTEEPSYTSSRKGLGSVGSSTGLRCRIPAAAGTATERQPGTATSQRGAATANGRLWRHRAGHVPYRAGMTHPEAATAITVRSPQGGRLEVLLSGPKAGFPLLYHSGTPSAAVPYPQLTAAAEGQGLRLIRYSRPGYGDSEPRRVPGTLADDVADSAAVLDAVGAAEFVSLGWSGGGPRAVASAALLPGRCRAAATLAGVAPRQAPGLDWLSGMGEENFEEFTAAAAGQRELEAWLAEHGAPVLRATADQVAEALGSLVPEVDRASLTGEFADYVARSFRHAGRQGVVGWRDDDLLLLAPWGVDLGSVRVPVSVWHGGQDRMVPFSHGRWLAAHIAGARTHLYDNEGHLSLVAQLDRILADLVQQAGLRPG